MSGAFNFGGEQRFGLQQGLWCMRSKINSFLIIITNKFLSNNFKLKTNDNLV